MSHNNQVCKHSYYENCPYCTLEIGVKLIESIMPQMKNISIDIGLLNKFLIESSSVLDATGNQ